MSHAICITTFRHDSDATQIHANPIDRCFLRVGRMRGAEIQLQDENIDMLHAAIEVRDGKLTLHNLASPNSLLVTLNGKPLSSGRVPLNAHDAIHIGTNLIQLSQAEAVSAPQAAVLANAANVDNEAAPGSIEDAVTGALDESSDEFAVPANAPNPPYRPKREFYNTAYLIAQMQDDSRRIQSTALLAGAACLVGVVSMALFAM